MSDEIEEENVGKKNTKAKKTTAPIEEEQSEPDADSNVDLQKENSDLKDKLLRTLAESENVRRRAERQVSDAASYSVANFARDMLSISDNLRRALDSLPKDKAVQDSIKAFSEGVEMTERELLNIFDRHGIKKLTPEGEKFNHDFHQAMFKAPNPDIPSGTIIQVVQPGYVLKERLLRPAMVGVSEGGKVEEEDIDTEA
ncbi:MAG: nucleotide exchange factor GrpE [Sphingomonadales bacterium]|jgi:molecular chaperone GrpE